MSSCPDRIYPLTTETTAAVIAKLAAEGVVIDPTQPTGSADGPHGVKLSWVISTTEIVVSIPSKPLLIPCSTIASTLDKLFST